MKGRIWLCSFSSLDCFDDGVDSIALGLILIGASPDVGPCRESSVELEWVESSRLVLELELLAPSYSKFPSSNETRRPASRCPPKGIPSTEFPEKLTLAGFIVPRDGIWDLRAEVKSGEDRVRGSSEAGVEVF